MRVLIILTACCLLAACVTTRYQSPDEVPLHEKGVYEKMHGYTACCQANFDQLDQALDGSNPVLAANRSLQACQPRLDDFQTFVADKTGDESFAEVEAEKLRRATGEKLLEPAVE